MIEEFYETIKDKHNISLEECKLICNSPFKLVKEILNKGYLLPIRLKYFGIFAVSQIRLKYSIKKKNESKN